MRVVCDNCKTKYSIGDDKVRGKVFKIRCKKCQHVIVVKGGESAEAASAVSAVAAAGGGGAALAQAGQAPYEEKETRVFDYAGAGFDTGSAAEGAPPAEEPANSAVWHLVVEGEQVGPFSDADVVSKIQAGEVGGETFAWRDGFADWQRIKGIADFSEALSALPPTDVAHQPMFGAMAAQAAESAQRQPGAATPAPEAAASPMQARTPAPVAATTASRATAKSPGESMFEDEPAAAQPKLTATRNENSVLFSLSDLAGRATNAAAAARSSSSALPLSGADSSGLADIRSMAAAVPKDRDDDDLVSALGRFSAGPASPVLLAPVGSSYPKWLLPLAVGGGFLLLLLVGTLSYVVFFKQSAPVATTETQAAAPPVAPAPVVPAAAAPSPTDPVKTSSTESVVQPGPAVAAGAPTGADSKPAGTTKKSTKSEPRPSGSPSSSASSEPKASKPSSKGGGDELDQLLSGAIQGGGSFNRPKASAPAASAAPDPNLPEQLNRSQIQKGMGAVKAKVGGCFDQYHVPGVVSVRVVVGGTGRVSVATVTGQFAGTPTGTCVEKAVKVARFDQFSGPSQSIDYPYVLPIR